MTPDDAVYPKTETISAGGAESGIDPASGKISNLRLCHVAPTHAEVQSPRFFESFRSSDGVGRERRFTHGGSNDSYNVWIEGNLATGDGVVGRYVVQRTCIDAARSSPPPPGFIVTLDALAAYRRPGARDRGGKTRAGSGCVLGRPRSRTEAATVRGRLQSRQGLARFSEKHIAKVMRGNTPRVTREARRPAAVE